MIGLSTVGWTGMQYEMPFFLECFREFHLRTFRNKSHNLFFDFKLRIICTQTVERMCTDPEWFLCPEKSKKLLRNQLLPVTAHIAEFSLYKCRNQLIPQLHHKHRIVFMKRNRSYILNLPVKIFQPCCLDMSMCKSV